MTKDGPSLARPKERKGHHNEGDERNADRPPNDEQQLKGQGVWLHRLPAFLQLVRPSISEPLALRALQYSGCPS